MKKGGVSFVLLISLVFLISFVASANETTTTNEKAYSCLNSLVSGKCSSLSTEEQIFSLLSIEACKTEVVSNSLANQCWPSTGCKIKTTAQAILALKHVNTDTSEAENWLLTQKANYPDIDWFLQVETDAKTSCTSTYSSGSYSFTVNADKTITGGSNSCFSVYNNYWLKISPSCYGQEIKVSCQDSFLTSLLYKKKTSTIVYVSEKTNSAPGEGSTTEIVSSSCFKEGTSCTYEGTLWAALVLKYRGYDVSSYLPYLISLADDNQKYIPYSFLYSLTNNFKVDLLAQQQQNKWWAASGDKFYDTAVALLPFPNEQISEKTNSMNWLQSVQGTDGCWQDNIRNTAFLLYSIWPKKSFVQNTSLSDCESSGYSCMSSSACATAGGNILTNYGGCFGVNKCCDKQQQLQSCSQQNGDLCSSSESCLGGTTVSSSDSTGGKSCCIQGTCGTQQTSSTECQSQGGICKSSCSSSEDTASYSCGSSYACCIQKQSSGISTAVIIILVILIILVLVGIIFRKKLREIFSKFGKGKAKPSGPSGRFPPSSAQRVYPVQRRIIQPQSRAPVRRPQGKSEFDDVLKKLKEIGK